MDSRGTSGDDDSLGLNSLFTVDCEGEWPFFEIDDRHVTGQKFGPEPFGLCSHLLHKLGPHDPLCEPGVILNLCRGRKLTACLPALDEKRGEISPRRIHCCGQTSGARSNDGDVAHGVNVSQGLRRVHGPGLRAPLQFLIESTDTSAKNLVGQGPIQDVIGSSAFFRERHLALDASESLGDREAVACSQAGDLRLAVGGDNDDFVDAFVDPGFEEERHVIDDDRLGVRSGCFPCQTYLFAGDAGVNDLFQRSTFGRMAEHHCPKYVAIDRPVWIQHSLAERFDNFPPGRFAGVDHVAGELVRIDDDSAALLEDPCDGSFSGGDAAGDADENHGREGYMRMWHKVEVEELWEMILSHVTSF